MGIQQKKSDLWRGWRSCIPAAINRPHQGTDWWTEKGIAQVQNLQQPHEVTFSPSLPTPTQSSQATHQSNWDPSLPGDLTSLDTDYTVVSTTNSLTTLWTQSEKSQEPTDSNWDSVEKSGMCFGNRTQRTSNPPFSGEIQLSHSSLRKPWETQFSQCSPYVSLLLVCEILRFCESRWFSGELGRTVGLRWGSSELLWIRMVG